MERRAFIKALGAISLASASWLAGCGIGGGGGSVISASGVGAVDVNFTAGQSTVIPPGTDLVRVQGFDSSGNIVFGPNDMAPPPDGRLNFNLPTQVTVLEVLAFSAPQPV
jgi:hypothetical protein